MHCSPRCEAGIKSSAKCIRSKCAIATSFDVFFKRVCVCNVIEPVVFFGVGNTLDFSCAMASLRNETKRVVCTVEVACASSSILLTQAYRWK